jgi:uncharacterized protein DUF6522
MNSVQFEEGAVSVDATLIAEGLSIEAAQVQPLMRRGQITSLCERGVEEDAGHLRLTFFYGTRHFSLVVDANGSVAKRVPTTTDNDPHRATRGSLPSPDNRRKP